MTARELFDLIEGLPAEAKCGTIFYQSDLWFSSLDRNDNGGWESLSTAHAEALQRDAITDWLYQNGHSVMLPVLHSDRTWGVHWHIAIAISGNRFPTRTHALAAAVRYVAGQADSSPSSS